MVEIVTDGNIFEYTDKFPGFTAIVNPVNCFGVMGKGLALEFKNRYKGLFEFYAKSCVLGKVQIGSILPYYLNRGLMIYNFPTKLHWRDKSELDWISEGLSDLVEKCAFNRIDTLLLPAVGCGLGGLEFADVLHLVHFYFDVLKINVFLFAPH